MQVSFRIRRPTETVWSGFSRAVKVDYANLNPTVVGEARPEDCLKGARKGSQIRPVGPECLRSRILSLANGISETERDTERRAPAESCGS